MRGQLIAGRDAMTGWWRSLRHGPKLAQALRMTVSSLVAFASAEAMGLPQGFWAVITALIVTQSNVGGSLKAAFDRFIGSVFGAVYGSAVAFAIPHENGLTRAAALIVSVGPLSFMAVLSAGFRIAPITAIIVLLSTTGSTLGPIHFAVDRVSEVGLGCAAGLLVSVLIPAHAFSLVLKNAAQVANLLADQLDVLAEPDDRARIGSNALAVKTRQSFTRLETLVGEAARERRSHLADEADPDPLFRTLMRLRHDVVMLRRTLSDPGYETFQQDIAKPWSHAALTGAEALRDIGRALADKRLPEDSVAMADAVRDYRHALDDIRRQALFGDMSTDAVLQLFGAGFALEQFRLDLGDLAERAQELAVDVQQDGS